MSNITEITSLAQLNGILDKSPGKLSVIDFHAVWCSPCRTIAPVFLRLSNEKDYSNVNFLKCDVDAAQEVAAKYGIRAMPSFIFLKNGQTVETVRGANPPALEAALKQHSTSSAFSGKGMTLGDSSSNNPNTTAPDATGDGFLASLSPQAKMFIGLIAAYLILLYVKS